MTDEYVGGKLVTRIDGRRMVTPLFIVLVAIGGIDLLFALDSIPAVFGVTQEAYIVFAANAFALLGLRALFFLVKGLLDRLVYLSTGLSLILAFIGVKLILHWLHVDISPAVPEISTPVSLGVIVVVLAVVTVASLVKTRNDPTATAHPGSLKASRKAPAEQELLTGGTVAGRPGPPERGEVDQLRRAGQQLDHLADPDLAEVAGQRPVRRGLVRPDLGDPDGVRLVRRQVDHVQLAAGRRRAGPRRPAAACRRARTPSPARATIRTYRPIRPPCPPSSRGRP